MSLTGLKHALIGSSERRAARISAGAAGPGDPEIQRWSLHEAATSSVRHGPIHRVSPADLHDAPLQEFQDQLFQADGYRGARRSEAGRHGEECDG